MSTVPFLDLIETLFLFRRAWYCLKLFTASGGAFSVSLSSPALEPRDFSPKETVSLSHITVND